MSLSQTDVEYGYKMILGREASEPEITHMLGKHADWQNLRKVMLSSPEFHGKYKAMQTAQDAQVLPTLIHIHIPKTAGTTLTYSLAQEPAMHPHLALAQDQIADVAAMPLGQRRSIRYVFGHLTSEICDIYEAPYRVLCILRDPGPRIHSFYRYIMRTAAHPSHEYLNSQNMTFGQYLEFCEHNGDHLMEVDNGQLRRLASRMDDVRRGMAFEYVRPALGLLVRPGNFVGFADDLSPVLAQLAQAGYLSTTDITSLNVAPPDDPSYEQAMSELTPHQKTLMEEFTQWDNYLYQLCKGLFGL